MLKAFAAQGISPAGLEQFQSQWKEGRITDVLVSCLITYHATQKKGPKDPDVVALHGVLVAGGCAACWTTSSTSRMSTAE